MKQQIQCIFFLLLLGVVNSSQGQVFENDAAEREKLFIYEVTQINEFFGRFNNDTTSNIWKVYKQRGIKYRLERPPLIKSLFNTVSGTWRVSQVDSFITQALSVRMPSSNNFYGEGWFAEATCEFDYNGSIISIPVMLKIDTDKYKRSRWLIVAIRQNIIRDDQAAIAGGDIVSNQYFISPVSNGTDFSHLAAAFEDKAHLLSYFDPNIIRKSQSVTFYNAILKNQVKFRFVKEIKYHFLQVSNYIFTVENFKRKALNSGWLINQLRIVTPAEKENFKRNLLGE